MPIIECSKNGKKGYKYGKNGTCYLYNENDKESKRKAKEKALKQARALYASGYREQE